MLYFLWPRLFFRLAARSVDRDLEIADNSGNIPIHGATGSYATENSTSTTNDHTLYRGIIVTHERPLELLRGRCNKSCNLCARCDIKLRAISWKLLKSWLSFDREQRDVRLTQVDYGFLHVYRGKYTNVEHRLQHLEKMYRVMGSPHKLLSFRKKFSLMKISSYFQIF